MPLQLPDVSRFLHVSVQLLLPILPEALHILFQDQSPEAIPESPLLPFQHGNYFPMFLLLPGIPAQITPVCTVSLSPPYPIRYRKRNTIPSQVFLGKDQESVPYG
ncbi:hypothetical protein EVA_13198 [gut metagenome]|uniref:Uncharacterized protein n=1 Tax=gut metagenome TaxID=749906 RepID=J9FVZ8_9ZZZZ